MIPKKIHYCWFGNKPIPTILKKCLNSWKEKCPDYEIILWNEDNFDINCTEFVRKAYENKAWAFVSDYARLKIIHENGGIYLDTDVELLKSLDNLLNNKTFFATQQSAFNIATGLCFGSEKNCKILEEMMEEYNNIRFDINQKDDFICPVLNTKVLERHGFTFKNEIIKLKKIDVTIYPPEYFDPISIGKDSLNLLSEKSYSIHHYSASWMSKKTRLKRKISIFVGQDKINKIKRFLKS